MTRFRGNQKMFATHWENFDVVRAERLSRKSASSVCAKISTSLSDSLTRWRRVRDALDYEIDGVVVKVNSTALAGRIRDDDKSPRWAIAYKYPARQATTKLLDISIQVGRTGALTPVAHLEPTLLAGTTVARASLHNEDEIKRLDLKIGDYVLIEKSGEIIPQVLSNITVKARRQRKEHSNSRRNVPSAVLTPCGPRARRFAAAQIPIVPAKIKGRIAYFASRKAMDIEGLGDVLIDTLVDQAVIKDVADLYTLKLDDISNLERQRRKVGEETDRRRSRRARRAACSGCFSASIFAMSANAPPRSSPIISVDRQARCGDVSRRSWTSTRSG